MKNFKAIRAFFVVVNIVLILLIGLSYHYVASQNKKKSQCYFDKRNKTSCVHSWWV